MKACSALLLLLISAASFSQSGTIKIAKPITEKKDSLIPPPKRNTWIGFSAGTNYTFKGISKPGYEVTCMFPSGHFTFIGIKYSHEKQYYNLSAYNIETGASELHSGRSENSSDYLKVPVGIQYPISVGTNGIFFFCLGAEGEYLFHVKNQHGRLKYQDFRKYNLAGSVGIGIVLGNRYSVHICYSRDIFDNLKNNVIYNVPGTAAVTQKSKTNLLSLTLNFSLSR